MPKTRALIGDRGTTFTRSFAELLALLPLARDALHRPVRAQPRRAQQPAADGRLHAARHLELAAAVAPARPATARCTSASSSTATAGRAAHEVPPGFNDWHGTVDPSTYRFYRLHGQRERRAAPRYPGLYSTDFFAATGRRADRGGRPGAAARSSCRSPSWRPTAAGRASPTTRAGSRRRPWRRGTPTSSRRAPLPLAALVQRGRHVRQAARDAARAPPIGAVRVAADPGGLPAAAGVAAGGRRRGRLDRRDAALSRASSTTR